MTVENLKFYLSVEQACSYLPERKSASVFADPDGTMSVSLYSILINHGFRRSANYVYRPHCPSCTACKPTRIPVAFFNSNRNQKRTWKRNQDLLVNEAPAEFSEEHFELYKKYVHTRHGDGEMDHDDADRYFEFLHSDWCDTAFYEFRLDGKLLAVAVTDKLSQGLSALYTFFDPDYDKRSLGTFAVLWQIEEAAKSNLPWVYLGYWIKECKKMQYKSQFRPMQIWENDEWITI